jgi:hypothetical protein
MAQEGSHSAAGLLGSCRGDGGRRHALVRIEEFHADNGTVGLVLRPHDAGASSGCVEVIGVVAFDGEDLAEVDAAFDDHTDPSAADVQRPSIVFRFSTAQRETGRDLPSSTA